MASLHGVIRAIQPLSIRDTVRQNTVRLRPLGLLYAYPYFYNSKWGTIGLGLIRLLRWLFCEKTRPWCAFSLRTSGTARVLSLYVYSLAKSVPIYIGLCFAMVMKGLWNLGYIGC